MTSYVSFYKNYFLLAILLFFTEVIIAVFVHDHFIRPYAGDFLVVILIYCSLRSFLRMGTMTAALASLLFACFVETLQYFDLIHAMGWEHHKIMRIVIGTSFSWADIVCYSLGILTVVCIEFLLTKRKKRSTGQ